MTISTFTGICFVCAGLALLYRQMLLSPRNLTFPCAPVVVRMVMFICGIGTVFVGALFIDHRSAPYAGDAALPISLLAVGVVLYQVILLINVAQERRPKKVWDAIERVSERAGARPSRRRVDRHSAAV